MSPLSTQVKSGTIFDNFLITDDEKYAEEFGNETWGETKDAEKKMKDEQDEEERKKAEEAAKAMEEEEEEEEGEEDEDFDTEEVSEIPSAYSCSFRVVYQAYSFLPPKLLNVCRETKSSLGLDGIQTSKYLL